MHDTTAVNLEDTVPEGRGCKDIPRERVSYHKTDYNPVEKRLGREYILAASVRRQAYFRFQDQ